MLDGWAIREGAGGGQRVSAASQESGRLPEIAKAEAAMDALHQARLFIVHEGQGALDEALAARGYTIKDPVALYACDIAALTKDPVPPVSAFSLWPELAIQHEIWAQGGIGPARLAVMKRARGPKTTLLARAKDRAAGAAFVAIEQKTAMIHALEVLPELRRNGAAINMMRAAAFWAQDHGARFFSLVVTTANAPANALYSRLGMKVVGHYHYRIKQQNRAPEADRDQQYQPANGT